MKELNEICFFLHIHMFRKHFLKFRFGKKDRRISQNTNWKNKFDWYFFIH